MTPSQSAKFPSPSRKTRLVVGSFVRSDANVLGIGKLADVGNDTASVEYFLAPGVPTHTEVVPLESLTPLVLEEETRGYAFDRMTNSWLAGRILLPHQSDQYTVRFPNRITTEVSIEDLFVRWDLPIEDPIVFLEHRVTDTPRYHRDRFPFVRSITEQRGACAGMTGLLSSAIDLEPHQIEVVRRVLQDPVQRYLLADEVGLGKTIEAGVILRQYVLDDPKGHRALILVPPHLLSQWEQELRRRFHLGPLLGVSIHLASFQDAQTVQEHGSSAGLIVIDEAHQLSSWAMLDHGPQREQFELVRQVVVQRTDLRLLLLSATPALHNSQNGFHALLHLLDPVVYQLDNVAAFRLRLRQHQEVAELYHLFQPDETGDFLEEALDDLENGFPDDARLLALIGRLRPLLAYGADPNDPERERLVRTIRSHVSEAYRLHRRLLRNRRTADSVDGLLPGRDGLRRWTYRDAALALAFDRLDEWRVEATSHSESSEFVECHRLFLEAVCSDAKHLADLAQLRLEPHADYDGLGLQVSEHHLLTTTPHFPREGAFLERLRDAGRAAESLERPDALVAQLDGLFEKEPRTRVVAFVGASDVADEVFYRLQARWPGAVLRHGEPGWTQFRSHDSFRVLVCDRSAEDGLNLQGKNTVLVHYDVPFSPNRMEQRLGRLDRYGFGSPVRSYVLLEEQDRYSASWCDHLETAYQVFDRSIAALQYLVEEEMASLLPEMYLNGEPAIQSATERLSGDKGKIERTLHEIQVLDELDAVQMHPAQEDFAMELRERDLLHAPDWRDALTGWVVETLQFDHLHEAKTVPDWGRYQFQRPLEGGRSTLMPVGALARQFAHVLDAETSSSTPREPMTYALTSDRQRAQSRRAALARVGDAFVDSLTEYVRWDDRGACFAMWRMRAEPEFASPAEIYFRFDFIVECPIDGALQTLGANRSDWSLPTLRRQADWLFPPLSLTLWLDEERKLVEDPTRMALLEEPYDDEPSRSRPRDYNLNVFRWREIAERFPWSTWLNLIPAVRTTAESFVRLAPEVVAAVQERKDLADSLFSERYQQFESRLAFLPEGQRDEEQQRAELDRAIGRAFVEGIQQPSVRLDSVGAIFLANWNPFEED